MKSSLKSQEFKQFFSSYKSLKIGDLLFRYSLESSPKIGLIVSKKYGKAVDRNRFIRRCRSLYQSNFSNKNFILVIQPLNRNIGWQHLKSAFSTLNSTLSLV